MKCRQVYAALYDENPLYNVSGPFIAVYNIHHPFYCYHCVVLTLFSIEIKLKIISVQ